MFSAQLRETILGINKRFSNVSENLSRSVPDKIKDDPLKAFCE